MQCASFSKAYLSPLVGFPEDWRTLLIEVISFKEHCPESDFEQSGFELKAQDGHSANVDDISQADECTFDVWGPMIEPAEGK